MRRKTGVSGSVTGLDFSIEMAQAAHRNFPLPNVNVVDADVICLPFQENCFDMAVASASFPHFSDQQVAIDEIHRVLKEGARFYIIHLSSAEVVAKKHHQIGGVIEHDTIPPEDKLTQMLMQGHFRDISIEDHAGLYLATAINSK